MTRADIQAVQVLPGAASSLFGPDSIGGAVNIILKEPSRTTTVLESTGGSYQTAGGLLSVTRASQEAGLRLSLARDVSGGLRSDTDTKQVTANSTSTIKLPAGTFDTFFGYNQKDFGAFDFYTPGLGFPSREHTKTLLFESGCELDAQGLLIKPQVLWRRHYDTFILDRDQIRSTSVNRHRTDLVTPGVYLRDTLPYVGTVGSGIEYGSEHIVSTNLGKHIRDHASAYLDESWEAAGRLIPSWSLRFDDFDSFGGMLTGSAALKKILGERGTVRIGVAKTGRIPSFTELFYNDPTTIGDPALKPEEAFLFQAGGDYAARVVSFGSTVFFRKERNMIDWVKQSVSQSLWTARNISRADAKGIETYLRLRAGGNLELESNYTFVSKDTHESGLLYKYGQNFASHLANAVMKLRMPFVTGTCGLSYKKKPGRGGWFVLQTGFSRRLGGAGEIFCDLDNLLGKEYEEIPGIEQPGRNVRAGLRFEW